MGDGRWKMGDGRWEMGDGWRCLRQQTNPAQEITGPTETETVFPTNAHESTRREDEEEEPGTAGSNLGPVTFDSIAAQSSCLHRANFPSGMPDPTRCETTPSPRASGWFSFRLSTLSIQRDRSRTPSFASFFRPG